ncbi:ATPase family AAA domain-containing protein 2 isoform X7 [Oryzias latipes]
MATHRGRKETARSKAQPKRQHKPAKGSKKRPPAKARSKTSNVMRAKKRGPTKGIRAEPKKKRRTFSKQTRAVTRRKSLRLKKPAGVRRSGQKASSNPPKPAGRRDASKKTSGVRRKLVQKKKMDKIKSKKLVKTDQSRVIYSAAVTDEDSGLGMTADDDSNGSVCDAILSRDRHSEFLRGSFPISSSGPDATRRTPFSTWSNQSMEEDSDDEDERASNSRRALSLQTEELLGTRRKRLAGGAGLADIDPMAVDGSVGFDSIGGLSGHISALKEMVIFPLLYPEVFDNFKIQPPRGCLFYGPPGTGKTLVARALANECSHGNRKVAFFMRKGADCLSKWVGESERQLRLLFEQAYLKRPSIIFFDEIDGLAPVRSSRQDQIHSSIVSTLLALMDGLENRGEVVVIGATNRLDFIDPALRRPGRFDREFLFGLPDIESRKEILKIHTRQWNPPPSEDFLSELAEKCVGYCGADIRAVCTEAALCALRRRYPQIYSTSQKLLLDVSSISVSSCDFVAAMRKMSPASHRSAAFPAKPLSPVVQPLLGGALLHVMEVLRRLFPHAEQGTKRKREPDLTSGVVDDGLMGGVDENAETSNISGPSPSKNFLHFARSAVKQPTSHRPRMLLVGRPGSGQTSHLAPAVLHALERYAIHSLDSAVLFGVSSVSPEEACAQVFCEAKRTSPSILYMPHVQQWWDTAGPALRASFLSLLDSIPSFSPILLLATCSLPHQELDPDIQFLFREEYGEVYTLKVPTKQERTAFFQDLLLNQAAEAAASRRKSRNQDLEILPLAPLPPPRQLWEQEEDVLRDLRLFLRGVTESLMVERRFKIFSKPVDIEEVPDYLMVIKKPMDLSTLLTNIDEHKYTTVGEFLEDAELIWKNALEYNPDSDPLDRHIRHRACALKDGIQTFIRDRLDRDFAKLCEEIKETRIQRAMSRGVQMGGPERGFSSSAFSRKSAGLEEQRKHETRANNAALDQVQQFNKDRSAEVDKHPPPAVNRNKLKLLLDSAVAQTDGVEVEPLEKLYALLAQCIYRHRDSNNKAELIEEMKAEIDNFS